MSGITEEIISGGEVVHEEDTRVAEAKQGIEVCQKAISEINEKLEPCNARLAELRTPLGDQRIDELQKTFSLDEYHNLQVTVQGHHATIKFWNEKRDIASMRMKRIELERQSESECHFV